jgi:hypothetical protein
MFIEMVPDRRIYPLTAVHQIQQPKLNHVHVELLGDRREEINLRTTTPINLCSNGEVADITERT